MLYVSAIVNTHYQQDSYVNYDYSVGKFIIPEGTPPFTPVKVPITLDEGYSHEYVEFPFAYVAHDGKGNTQGLTLSYGGTEDDCILELSNPHPEEFDYLPPNDCDNAVRVDNL